VGRLRQLARRLKKRGEHRLGRVCRARHIDDLHTWVIVVNPSLALPNGLRVAIDATNQALLGIGQQMVANLGGKRGKAGVEME